MSQNPWIGSLADAFINNALSALGAGARAIENPGEFLRDDLPPGTDGLTRWIQDRNRRACRRHARNEAAGLYSNLGALRRPRYGHCRPYLDSINEGPTSEGSYASPFTGGQCPLAYTRGVVYYVTTFVKASDPNNVVTNSGNRVAWSFASRFGPISLGSSGWERIEGQNQIVAYVDISYKNSLGQGEVDRVNFSGVPDEGELGPATGLSVSITNLELTPATGNPDDCGDPPNQYEPPRYPTGLPPLPPPTIAPPGGDGGDDIEVDPDGNWRFCENGDCTPWFTPGGGGTPADPGGEEDGDPQENDPSDPNDPQEISGCVEDGNLLTGLKIEITETPINSSGSNGINYRVAWIFMGPDSDKLDLVSDGKTLEDGQFVIPDSTDCTCYKVRMNSGWGLRVQAFSRPKEE